MLERNYGIELYRCLLMWGICLLHSVSQGIYKLPLVENSLLFCVDGFIFITGYYGTSFKWSKVLKLYGVAFYAGILVVTYAAFQGVFDGMSQVATMKMIKGVFLEAWFLNGYIVVLCFAPMVNVVFSSRRCMKTLLPLGILVFGWSFLRSSPYVGIIMPTSDGIGAYSGITLLGVYICGRLVRLSEDNIQVNRGILVLVGVLSLFICMIGFGNYASPFAVIVSCSLFFLFKQIKLNAIIQRSVTLLGPSLFSVYLLHSTGIGFNLIKSIELELKAGAILGCLSCSVIVMIGCLLLDVPRRICVYYLRPVIKMNLLLLDKKWQEIENAIACKLEDISGDIK